MGQNVFSAEQVEAIRRYQDSQQYHPLTCSCDSNIILEPTIDGLKCYRCGSVQTWCPAVVFEVTQ